MATKSPNKGYKKPGKSGKTSLNRITEKDLDVPNDAAISVKGGKKKKKKLTPKLVPIPT